MFKNSLHKDSIPVSIVGQPSRRRVLVLGECGFADPHCGVMLERAMRLHSSGCQVIFAYCDGCLDACRENPQGSGIVCAFCRITRKKFMRVLPKDIRLIPLHRTPFESSFTYSSLNELKAIRYRDAWIGYAALSSYISATRNSRPDFLNPIVKQYFDHALRLAAGMADTCVNLIESEHIDEIHIFNGRLFDNRAFYDIAVARGISFYSNEVIGSFRARTDFECITYKNSLPHNLKVNYGMAEKLWDMDGVPMSEKQRLGTEFYEKRRNSQMAGDRVYTLNQVNGLLPENFSRDKENIVIFNSSEDEFASIGKDFDDYQLFKNQTAGIQFLLKNLPADKYQIYVRIHPNLTRVKYDYVMELFELPKKYENVTLIPPDSKVSTYALMDAADKVVVFGSTMGAEASYSGKPVILVGPSFYYFLNVAYTPESEQELIDLIKTKNLSVKPKVNALKFAYFLMERRRLAEPGKFFDFHLKPLRFMGTTFYVTAYCKLLGSCLLMKLLRILIVYGARRFGKWKLGSPIFDDHCHS